MFPPTPLFSKIQLAKRRVIIIIHIVNFMVELCAAYIILIDHRNYFINRMKISLNDFNKNYKLFVHSLDNYYYYDPYYQYHYHYHSGCELNSPELEPNSSENVRD